MASNAQIKGITIKIEGDTSPLAKDLQSINKDITQTQRALKDVEAALKLDPTNVELLAQKQQLLNKQIEQTSEKLELERQAGEDAKEALEIGNISAEEYATLQAEIVKTETSLNSLEGQANGTADELEQTGDAAKNAGEKAAESGANWEQMAAVIGGAAEAAVVAIAAVTAAVAATAAALADASIEAANYADDINTLSMTSGVATDTLQALQYGEDLLDVSTGTVSSAITKLIKAMGSAQDSETAWRESMDELNAALESGELTTEAYQEAVDELGSASGFADLGINILDASGNLRDSEQVFWEVIDALGQISNETERDAAAMSIFGRSARELNPLIEAGSEGFRAVYEEAEAAGAIMSGEMLDAFTELDDTLSRLDQGTQAAKRALGSVLLPILNDLGGEGVNLINEFTNAVLDTNGDIEQLGAVIDTMVPQVIDLLNSYLPTLVELGFSIISTLAGSLLDNLPTILQSGTELLFSIAQGIIDHLSDLAPIIANLVVTLANFIISNLPTVISSAVEIVVAVVNGISQALPELIPAAVSCVEQIAVALIDSIDLLLPAALELMLALALGLVAAIPDLLACIPEIANALRNELVEIGPSIADAALTWGADLIDNFISGITAGFGRLGSALSDMASTVDSFIGFSVPERGPLHEWAYNNPGEDMVDLFSEGIDDGQAVLERSLYGTANIISTGMTQDYSGALAGISSQLGSLSAAGDGMPHIINLYMGTAPVGSVVVNAMDTEYYLSGGN